MMLFGHVTFERLMIDTKAIVGRGLQSGAQGDVGDVGYTDLGCLSMEVIFKVIQWMVAVTKEESVA